MLKWIYFAIDQWWFYKLNSLSLTQSKTQLKLYQSNSSIKFGIIWTILEFVYQEIFHSRPGHVWYIGIRGFTVVWF